MGNIWYTLEYTCSIDFYIRKSMRNMLCAKPLRLENKILHRNLWIMKKYAKCMRYIINYYYIYITHMIGSTHLRHRLWSPHDQKSTMGVLISRRKHCFIPRHTPWALQKTARSPRFAPRGGSLWTQQVPHSCFMTFSMRYSW
jgi:hypothetical protein